MVCGLTNRSRAHTQSSLHHKVVYSIYFAIPSPLWLPLPQAGRSGGPMVYSARGPLNGPQYQRYSPRGQGGRAPPGPLAIICPITFFMTLRCSRLNSVLIDVHRCLAQLCWSDILALTDEPSSFYCSLHTVPTATPAEGSGRRHRSHSHRGFHGSTPLPANDLRHFISGPSKSADRFSFRQPSSSPMSPWLIGSFSDDPSSVPRPLSVRCSELTSSSSSVLV